MRKSIVGVVATLAIFVIKGAIAQDAWSTRSELGFVAARGNTSAETGNAKVEIVREINKWKYTLATTGRRPAGREALVGQTLLKLSLAVQ